MRSFTVEGIVLKRLDTGEADRVVTLFTRSHGKVTAIARGVRKITSRRAGSIELFNHVRAHIIQGKGSLDILGEVQLVNSFPDWRKAIGRVTLAFQLAEAIDKLTPDREVHPQLFHILSTSLTDISRLSSDWKRVTDDWLVQIVQELGYFPRREEFKGNIQEFIEDISSRPLHSLKLLTKLK